MWGVRGVVCVPCATESDVRRAHPRTIVSAPAHANRLSVYWADAESARGGVSNLSMGGVNPPALVLDRKRASG